MSTSLKCAEKPKTTSVFVEKFCSIFLRLPKTTFESFRTVKENFYYNITRLMNVTRDQIAITEGCNVKFTMTIASFLVKWLLLNILLITVVSMSMNKIK